MGSLAYPPANVGKFEVVGRLFGQPLEVAPCATIDLHVPAAAEIVIEGEIAPREREAEGPFGEFTGYFSRRSTEHVFVARDRDARAAVVPVDRLGSGGGSHHDARAGARGGDPERARPRDPERHGRPRAAVRRVVLTAFVSITQTRPGEAKHVIPIVLGVDHYLKLVVVVDEDVDVFDESDVLWAVATRMQADRDLVAISGSLGAMLDPSADDRGITAKLGIDATRPFGEPFAEKLVMPAERMQWARAGRAALARGGRTDAARMTRPRGDLRRGVRALPGRHPLDRARAVRGELEFLPCQSGERRARFPAWRKRVAWRRSSSCSPTAACSPATPPFPRSCAT